MTAVHNAPQYGGEFEVTEVTLSYPNRETPVLRGVSAQIEPGSMTVIVGPNACGKSTLLRALGRILQPGEGTVALDGKAVHSYGSKEFAREVGFLAQSAIAPDAITVGDLVARGRFPHQGMFRQWSETDEQAVLKALESTGTLPLADREVADLSGGQRQRAWIAMVLAQETRVLLLDEPTTFLDLCHQIEILELCRELNQRHGTTVIAVLHDLNQAARYADQIIAMAEGRIVAHGRPEEVITSQTVEAIFGVHSRVMADPETGTPLIVPVAGPYSRRVGNSVPEEAGQGT
nr:ABC transporter ATP-binding protein [Kocuria coralli]